MSPEGRDTASLWDMLDAAGTVCDLPSGCSRAEFTSDRLRQLAVVRCLEIVGEAARRISQPFKETHRDIPWSRMKGLRNVLIHEYDRVDYEQVWKIATEDVPSLIEMLGPLLPAPPADAEENP